VTQPLSSGGEGSAVVFDGVFVVLAGRTSTRVLRDDLYLFLAFLLASGIFMPADDRLPQERAANGAPAAPAAPGASPAHDPRSAAAPGHFSSRIPADALGAHGRRSPRPRRGWSGPSTSPPA